MSRNTPKLEEYKELNDFVQWYTSKMKRRINLWGFWFILLNVLILIITVVLSILGSIQLYYNFKAFGEDSWSKYLLITTGITAGTTFFTSIMSFFSLRKKIIKYRDRLDKINVELVLYNQRLGEYRHKKRDLNFYKNFCEICSLNYEGISYGTRDKQQ
ncbi:DUF4231 domain-containing protein [[Mycoplasma] gypis]|uniref:DUF4231 domain-containing protein n=1 Tax=[Mycoplasma] gypis TaxID=92404 RepID=A0ABZ2RMJ5_9BACT|nr:DUF4231 domain-containing protein [[Mycoplasma] gypis]MBN0919037.1 DUF4231 domain-containing protein [[Mycoplasma] gypis]